MKKHREFWIDDVLNVDRPNQKTAYIHEQDADDKTTRPIHVIEYAACRELQAKLDKAIEALKYYADDNSYKEKKYFDMTEVEYDHGFIATQALEELEG